MKKHAKKDWRVRFLAEGFGLGPHAFASQVEEKLRREISLTEFSEQLHEQLDPVGFEDFLRPSTVSWLYDTALRARSERETANLARRQMTTREWLKRKKRFEKLIQMLGEYSTFDVELTLRKASSDVGDSRTGRRAARLLKDLRALNYQTKKWATFVEWEPLRDSYRSYVMAADKHLQGRSGKLTKTQRAVIIQTTLDASGLNSKATAESILRALRRAQYKKSK